MGQIIHGGKFSKKHVAKCGLYRNQIWKDGDICLDYVDGIKKVTCRACLANHKEGKC
jgi:hypothetical protein